MWGPVQHNYGGPFFLSLSLYDFSDALLQVSVQIIALLTSLHFSAICITVHFWSDRWWWFQPVENLDTICHTRLALTTFCEFLAMCFVQKQKQCYFSKCGAHKFVGALLSQTVWILLNPALLWNLCGISELCVQSVFTRHLKYCLN